MKLTTQLRLLLDSALLNLPYFLFKREVERAERHGIPLSYEDLKMHYMAGGDIGSLVGGLIYAQQHGLHISSSKACARELSIKFTGRSLTQHLQEFRAAGVRDLDAAPLRIEDLDQPPAPPIPRENFTVLLARAEAQFQVETGWLLNRRGEKIYRGAYAAGLVGFLVAIWVHRQTPVYGPGILYTGLGGMFALLTMRFLIYARPNTMTDRTLAKSPPPSANLAVVLVVLAASLGVTACGIIGLFSPSTLGAILSALAPF